MIFHHHSRTVLKGRVGLPNWKNFRKSAKGGGAVIFNPKIDVAVFGNFKQGFSIIKLIQLVIGFRVCFFNNCIEKNQNKTHLKKALVVITV